MRYKIQFFFILAFILGNSLNGISQNVDYTVTITELYADGDSNDGGIGINDQDPTWFLHIMDNGTTVPAFLTPGCIATTNTYGTWWSGNPSDTGPTIPFAWLNIVNSNATQLITEMEGWEDDCHSNCDYEPSPGIFTSCVGNGDDNHDGRGPSGNIDFQLDPPCTNTEYEIFIGDYKAHLEVNWHYVNVDAGTINGDQFACVGGDPTVLGSVSIGSAATSVWFTYQWQIDLGCTGAFADIAGATSATYDPPVGILQNTCYRRLLVDNCSTYPSNEITVQIETVSTAPSSITASPSSLCGAGPITLIVNGGALGTNSNWQWYNGDPNVAGVSLGSGTPLIVNLSTTTNIFVRAEGNCGFTNTADVIVVVELPSLAPTTITPSLNTICVGSSVNLSASGGAPGTNSMYAWYETDPTIGAPAPLFTSTSSNYTSVFPLITTTYYVRLEGCDTTATATTIVTVNTLSSDPSGITSSNAQVCVGTNVALSVTGGSLGTGANWFWYEAGCGAGAPIGNGLNISVTPSVTTTYFVRAEGTCNNSACASVTIIVDDNSVAPVNIIVSDPSVCPGDVVQLTVIGGSLGTGATWEWYNGACGGLNVGSGSTIAINPIATADYYVRAEGTCNTTVCANTTITIETLSVIPTGATASVNNICPNAPVTLTAVGGSLGSGANWEWYQGSCGGIYVGSGNNLVVNPSQTTTYYARAEGNCNTSGCESVTVIVNPPSIQPSSILASNMSVCPGGTIGLSVNGGTLTAGDTWTWYEAGCGSGAALGTGLSLNVAPIANTTYYVRAEGPCGFSNCANIAITIDAVSTVPTGITASATAICVGQSVVLNVSGGTLGTGANWQWYQGSCGTGPVGTGNSISVSPTGTTTYFVRGEGTCGNSMCVDVTINVGAGVADPTAAIASVNNICPGDATDLTVVGAVLPAGYTYVWYTGACGAVPVGVGTTLTVNPTVTETYYVRAVGTCGETACADVTVTVVDGSIPAVGILASNNNFCLGESTNLTVDGGSLSVGAQWTWYENSCGGIQVGTGTSITVTPNNSTSFYVRAEGGTCGNTVCADIFISVIATIVHVNPFDSICGAGPSFQLEGGEPTGGVYTGVGVVNGEFIPSLAGEGTHIITYTYTSNVGCVETVTAPIVITPTEMTAEIVIGFNSCSQGGTTLSANTTSSNGFLDYQWSDGSYEDQVTFAQEGTYFVWVRDADDCIVKSDEVVVTEEMECVDIPNTFTPNGDGKNDTWNLDFSRYTDVKLLVFSKWGREVFLSEGKEIHWDGNTYGGKKLPPAVYYYTLELNGGEISQSGYITLLR